MRSLTSIKPSGGIIPCVDVLILKKYPQLVQYFARGQKIVTYSEAVSCSSVVDPKNPNEFFFATLLVSDALLVYDKSVSITSQPMVEIFVTFSEPQTYYSLQEGHRIRIFNPLCESSDF